ncbi:sugar phosphate isomerase/epimerase family protein [Sphingomonas sp. T1]|uniref:sugar phosphate isomerase/epimerase family protein n=1 Tax=Sphingomonas sp. T1 TaxID=2653172 RepID=UPI001F2D68CB|nr:sugar phosphate isomerase/epimerase [Sphingomonas sp. T1]
MPTPVPFAVIGGGEGAFIGEVHRWAAAPAGNCRLVAGTWGVGSVMGSLVANAVYVASTHGRTHDWRAIWMVPAGLGTGCRNHLHSHLSRAAKDQHQRRGHGMTISRRGVIRGLAMGAAATAWSRAASARTGYPWPLGVQLWSVNAELDRDMDATLRDLARLGYREVETAGLHGHEPAAFARAITSAGLRAVSAHYSMPDLFTDAAGHIAEAKAMGVQWLVASSPRADRPLKSGDWIPAIHDAMTLDAWKANAARLNEVGRMAHKAGLQFAYHNHPIEFDHYDGQRGFEVLLAGTDAALVKLELDVAWAVAGGVDPVALLRQHGDRIRMIHVKGLKTKPTVGTYGTDFATGIVGQGNVIAWPAVFAAAKKAGVIHAFVEQEPPYERPIMQSLVECRDYLESL